MVARMNKKTRTRNRHSGPSHRDGSYPHKSIFYLRYDRNFSHGNSNRGCHEYIERTVGFPGFSFLEFAHIQRGGHNLPRAL
jgi:hypothetical protein